jgi:hypothetical protein
MATNLLLDKPEPKSKISLHQILMSIPSQAHSNKTLFHAIDAQWCSNNVVNFCFLPENEADARRIIAGLVPYLWDSHDPWYMSAFSNEANFDTNPHGGIIKCGWCSWPMNTKFLIS